MKIADSHFDFSHQDHQPKPFKAEVLLAEYADGQRHFNNVDLRDCNLAHAKIPMISLEESIFQRANLVGANLAGSTLNHVDFSLANLSNTNFIAADIVRAKLIGANLTGAVLSGANLSGANLRKTNLTNCIFAGANLSGVDFSGAILKNVNFGGANLKGANLSDVELEDVDLAHVDLTETILPEGLAGQRWLSQNRDFSINFGESVPAWSGFSELSPPTSDIVHDQPEQEPDGETAFAATTNSDEAIYLSSELNDNSRVKHVDLSYSQSVIPINTATESSSKAYAESVDVESEIYVANVSGEDDAEEYVETSLGLHRQPQEETYADAPFDPFYQEEMSGINDIEQAWSEATEADAIDEESLYLQALDAIDAIAMESADASMTQPLASYGFSYQEVADVDDSELSNSEETIFSPFATDAIANSAEISNSDGSFPEHHFDDHENTNLSSVDPFNDDAQNNQTPFVLDDPEITDQLSESLNSDHGSNQDVTNPFLIVHHQQGSEKVKDTPDDSLALIPVSQTNDNTLFLTDALPDVESNSEAGVTTDAEVTSFSTDSLTTFDLTNSVVQADLQTSVDPDTETEANHQETNEVVGDALEQEPSTSFAYADNAQVAFQEKDIDQKTVQDQPVDAIDNREITNKNPLSKDFSQRAKSDADLTSKPKGLPSINSRVVQSIQSVLSRRVQYSLQRKLLDIYHNRCAVTGCDIQPLLDTVFITSHDREQADHPSECLVLRSDLKTLYELKLLAVHPKTCTVLLAPQLLESDYSYLQGRSITIPDQTIYRPNPESLAQNLQDCVWYDSDYRESSTTTGVSRSELQVAIQKTSQPAYWPTVIALGLGSIVGSGLMWAVRFPAPSTITQAETLPVQPNASSQSRINIQVGDLRYNQQGIILNQKSYLPVVQAQQLGLLDDDIPAEYQQQYEDETYVSLSYLNTLGISVSWDAESRTATLDCCQSIELDPIDLAVNNRDWPSAGFILDNMAYVSQQRIVDLGLEPDLLGSVHSVIYRGDNYLRASDLKSLSITLEWNPETRVLRLEKE